MAKKAAAKKALTKSQLLNELAERTNLSKKEVADFLEVLEGLIEENLSKSGPGVFTIPSLMKIARKTRKARPARPGRNPQTGEEIMLPAKPESEYVKVTALKKLKEMA